MKTTYTNADDASCTTSMHVKSKLWVNTSLVVMLSLTACEKGKVLSLNKTDTASDKNLVGDSSGDSTTVSGEYNSKYKGNQYLNGSSASGTQGASVAFPPGSLGVSVTVSMQTGTDVATTEVASGLGVDSTVSVASSPITVSSNPATNASNPFTLSIPLSTSASKLAIVDNDNLVVMYERYDATKKAYVTGLLPKSQFTFSNNIAKISVTYFGTYQLGYTSKTQSDAKSVDGAAKSIAKKATSSTSASSATNTSGTTGGSTGGAAGGSSNPLVPSVTSVSSTLTTGTNFKASQVVMISVNFDKSVTVTGNPELTLNIAGAKAIYSVGTGSITLTFSYTVAAGQNIAILNYDTVNALSLAGGTIKSTADGVDANLLLPTPATSALQSKGFVIDTTAPSVTITAAQTPTSSSSTSFNVTFSESVTGFTTSSLQSIGLGSLSLTGSGSSYTVSANFSSTSSDNSVTLIVLAAAAIDNAGNQSTAGSGAADFWTAPLITGLSMTAPGLTLTPSVTFNTDKALTAFEFFSDPTCSTPRGTIGQSRSSGSVTATLPAGAALATTGSHPIYGKAVRDSSWNVASCVNFGTYYTGINKVVTAANASAGSTSSAWACAIVNGNLKCWGHNGSKQLGDGTTTSRNTPTSVPSLQNVQKVAMASDWNTGSKQTTCAIAGSSSTVYCWGANNFGQAAPGSATATITTPTPINIANATPLTNAKQLVGSVDRFCAITTSNLLYCWGNNSYGQLGVSLVTMTDTTANYPNQVAISSNTIDDVFLGDSHTCATAHAAGNTPGLWCWGKNDYRQTYPNSSTTSVTTPTNVIASNSNVSKASLDDYNTCAIVGTGVSCWGQNNNGRNANSTTTVGSTQNSVFSITSLASFSPVDLVSGSFAYAISGAASANMKAWGMHDATNYQLYTSSFTSDRSTPIAPSTAGGVGLPSSSYSVTGLGASKAMGSLEVACIIVNGGVMCRGISTFPGIGTSSGFLTGLSANSSVVQVDANRSFGCANVAFSSVSCWGDNNWGQIGDGTNTNAGATAKTVLQLP
jgi:hypothetical protein